VTPTQPVRVLELRSVRGTGGGPEKTILVGALQTDPRQVRTTVCYLRDQRDSIFEIGERASRMGLDYVEVPERHSWDLAAWARLRRLVRERQVDIVHSHEYKTDAMALWLSRVERVVPLATAHGWTGHSVRERRLYYPADRWLLRKFPRLIAVSTEIKQMLVKAGANPAKISVVLNGIDPSAFRRQRAVSADVRREFGVAPHEIVIGTVGRLEPQKRFDLLLNAVATLRAARPNLCLVIAGEGSLRAELERMAAALLPRDAYRLLGHRADVARVHHLFDLFVQSSDYEGTPNAVLEAMAMETPIVASDAGGTAELVRHDIDGLIVACGRVDLLAAAIEQALGDENATRARAAAARRRIEETLSFDARMRAVHAIYCQLMNRANNMTNAAECA
jgi:glycosyltransferase involved in cell wall biosynthesis